MIIMPPVHGNFGVPLSGASGMFRGYNYGLLVCWREVTHDTDLLTEFDR
jgi:hypothetical protein